MDAEGYIEEKTGIIAAKGLIIMCTAATLHGLFGRTLDLEYSYREAVTITPRDFNFGFCEARLPFAIIGMATVADGYPLYYDAINEKGLCAAALNFPKSARYFEEKAGKLNLASYQVIPFLLRQCGSVWEAERLLKYANISDRAFSDNFAASPLHWIISDRKRSLCIESCADGLHIYENSVGVLTNEPPFPLKLSSLSAYSDLSADEPRGDSISRGMGALGLPGDYSSQSRFARAVFLCRNSITEEDSIGQFFHILGSVEVPRGAVRLADGQNVITHYTSCMDMKQGIYYYKTYENSRITAIDMRREILSGNTLITYPLRRRQDIMLENG